MLDSRVSTTIIQHVLRRGVHTRLYVPEWKTLETGRRQTSVLSILEAIFFQLARLCLLSPILPGTSLSTLEDNALAVVPVIYSCLLILFWPKKAKDQPKCRTYYLASFNCLLPAKAGTTRVLVNLFCMNTAVQLVLLSSKQ